MAHSSEFSLLLFCAIILFTVSKSAGYYLIDEEENVRQMPKRASMNDLINSKYLDRCKLVDDQYQRLGAHLFHANLTVPFKVFHPIRQLDTLHDASSSSSASSSAEKTRSSSSGKRECDRQQRRTMMIGSTPHQSELAIRERALCPWEWRVNYDPRRWPAHLVEARCLCDEVKEDVQVPIHNSNGDITGYEDLFPSRSSGRAQKLVLHQKYECEHVYVSFQVLRFDEKCKTFTPSHEDIAVACATIEQADSYAVRGTLRTESLATPEI